MIDFEEFLKDPEKFVQSVIRGERLIVTKDGQPYFEVLPPKPRIGESAE